MSLFNFIFFLKKTGNVLEPNHLKELLMKPDKFLGTVGDCREYLVKIVSTITAATHGTSLKNKKRALGIAVEIALALFQGGNHCFEEGNVSLS